MSNQILPERLRYFARKQPEKTAIIWYGKEITYQQLDHLSDVFAGWLYSKGIRKGDRVALYLQNCPQYMIAHFGIQKIGAVVGPCSPLFKEFELNYQLADMGAKAIVAAYDLYEVIEKARKGTQLKQVVLTAYSDFLPEQTTYAIPETMPTKAEKPIPNTYDFLDIVQETEHRAPKKELSPTDVALIVYTSGTTGRPKGAMIPFQSAAYKASESAKRTGLNTDSIHLVIPPLYHISGMLCGINIPIYSGGTIVLHYRFDVLSTLQSIQQHKPNYWKGLAPMIRAILDEPNANKYDVSSLWYCAMTSFGIKTTKELAQEWEKFTNGCILSEAGYGLTETHTFDSLVAPNDIKWGTNGRLLDGVQCRIVDPETGKNLPANEDGEIVLKSIGNFLGYWNDEEKTAEVLRDGWVYTGDIGSLDENGYLTLKGRIKELIKVSGYSVFPEEVEAMLAQHEAIEQAGVIGIPDDRRGEVVKAVIQLKDGVETPSKESIIEWCRAHMATYKAPRVIEFREELPMTASGKVIRRALT